MKNRAFSGWLFVICLLLFVFLFLFALTEIGTRLFVKKTILWEYDKELRFRHVASSTGWWCKEGFCNEQHVNSAGFIDDEFSVGKKEGEKRVLMFGDSFMEALQVPISSSAHRLLEDKLKTVDKNFEVYNFGVSSYGTAQFFIALKKYAPIYNPDIVVFVIDLKNNLRELNPNLEFDECKPYFKLVNNTLEKLSFQCNRSTKAKIERFLRKSDFFVLIKSKIDSYRVRMNGKIKKDNLPLGLNRYNKNDKEFSKSFNLNEKLILEAKKYSSDIKSKFMIVVMYNDFEVYSKEKEKLFLEYPELKGEDWDLNYPHARTLNFCSLENISCLDLTKSFKEYVEKSGERVTFEKDVHLNKAGNKLTADEIFKFIVEQGYLENAK